VTDYVTGQQITRAGSTPEDGMATIVVCDYPPTQEERRTALDTAREVMLASFRARSVATPAGGWRLAMLHPDEDWHRWISPSKVPEVQAQLADAGPDAVALVIYAFRSDPR
jgi:hypothetical protein